MNAYILGFMADVGVALSYALGEKGTRMVKLFLDKECSSLRRLVCLL